MRRSKPPAGRPFYDGAIDIKRWKARRRQEHLVDRVGKRTLGLAASMMIVLPALAVLIDVNWPVLSQCELFVDVLRCVSMLATFLIPCVAVLIPIRLCTRIPAFIFRKLMHTVAFAAVTLVILRARRWQAVSLTFALAAVAAFVLLSFLENEKWYELLLVQKTRGEVKRSLTVYFVMVAILTALCGHVFHQRCIAATAIMMWGTGDAAAALIGIPFGKHRVKLAGGKKSWEGSASMLLVSFAVGLGMLMLVHGIGMPKALLYAGTGALLGTAAELFSPSEYDTITVPVVIAATLIVLCIVIDR